MCTFYSVIHSLHRHAKCTKKIIYASHFIDYFLLFHSILFLPYPVTELFLISLLPVFHSDHTRPNARIAFNISSFCELAVWETIQLNTHTTCSGCRFTLWHYICTNFGLLLVQHSTYLSLCELVVWETIQLNTLHVLLTDPLKHHKNVPFIQIHPLISSVFIPD
jgi:hypothetical protein